MNELLGRMRVLWNGLARREQMLLGVAGAGLAGVILIFGIVSPLLSATDEAVEQADGAERQLSLIQRRKRDWDNLDSRLGSVESRIHENTQGENLLTLLASLARRAGVKPTSMEKRQSGESDEYEETKVEVTLKNVTLQQAISYLASIESAPQPLSVKSLRIKRRPGSKRAKQEDAVDLLDVTFSVSSFKAI